MSATAGLAALVMGAIFVALLSAVFVIVVVLLSVCALMIALADRVSTLLPRSRQLVSRP